MQEELFSKVEWLKLSQLQSLGISKEVFFIFVIFLGIAGCYFVIRPITLILVSTKSDRVLSYLLSGLSFMTLFFIVVLISGEIQMITYQLLKFSLQALSIFGLILLIIHIYKNLLKKRNKV
ncbi:hypothetical protein [Ornithinibacillus scapharcae]|uniref:hypothetical protein n=1 Tax=Ornithinibacillus scapharcae TaxID=1147159 RepID=UPI000225AB16|nr:hypothetical protein [Ornithinibacillus scapharcae]